MEDKSTLVAILNRLVAAEYDGEPTIANIQAAVPSLQQMDWVNRFGPAGDWFAILSAFTTKDLERLIKIFVVAEREFDWIGGSVAAAIWMYRTYSLRMDGDPEVLADWVLRNKGRNDYLPFGSMTSARTLEDYHAELSRRARRAARQIKDEVQLRSNAMKNALD
jgi:hypothetical protein